MLFGLALGLVLAAPVGAAPSPAAAVDPETDRILNQARIEFDAGTDHYAAGRYEEAIRRFQAGYALVPRPNFLVNIGQAFRKLGNLERAKEAYVAYVRALPANSALRDQALQVLAEIEVQLQDQEAARPVASAPPQATPLPLVTPIPPARAPAPPRTSLGAWLGLGIGGAGLALVATGVGFQIRARSASGHLEEASRNESVFNPNEEAAGQRAEKIGNGLFAAGGAVMAAGLLLYLVVDSTSGTSSTEVASSPVQVGLSPAGVSLAGRF